jgi:hypothetical protein
MHTFLPSPQHSHFNPHFGSLDALIGLLKHIPPDSQDTVLPVSIMVPISRRIVHQLHIVQAHVDLINGCMIESPLIVHEVANRANLFLDSLVRPHQSVDDKKKKKKMRRTMNWFFARNVTLTVETSLFAHSHWFLADESQDAVDEERWENLNEEPLDLVDDGVAALHEIRIPEANLERVDVPDDVHHVGPLVEEPHDLVVEIDDLELSLAARKRERERMSCVKHEAQESVTLTAPPGSSTRLS